MSLAPHQFCQVFNRMPRLKTVMFCARDARGRIGQTVLGEAHRNRVLFKIGAGVTHPPVEERVRALREMNV